MDNKSIVLKSGAKLYMTLAPFQDGHNLFKAVTRELIGTSLQGEVNLALTMKLLSSEEVEKVLWPCMMRATYNGQKLSPDLFEPGDVRKDFLLVVKEVLDFNLIPFFPSLDSLFPESESTSTENQK